MGEKWRDPDEWASLTSPDGCPICLVGSPRDLLVELPTTWVTAPRTARLPGYVCVVAKRHVVEPFDLPADESAAFWTEAMQAARAVSVAAGAVKMGYEIHGFTIPHLHMHLFPHLRDDPPQPDADLNYTRSDADLSRLAGAIRVSAHGGIPVARLARADD